MSATAGTQQLAAIRGVWGALLLAAPGRMIGLVPGARQTLLERRVVRVLGVRQILQAGAVLAGSQLAARAWWVDALHSSSMVALAARAPAPRRLAVADAAVAAAFAVATRATAPSASHRLPRH